MIFTESIQNELGSCKLEFKHKKLTLKRTNYKLSRLCLCGFKTIHNHKALKYDETKLLLYFYGYYRSVYSNFFIKKLTF